MSYLETAQNLYKAAALDSLGRDGIFISESAFHYDGGGCC